MNKSSTNKNIPKVALQKIKSFLNLTDLPDDLNISTITVTCCFDTTFNVENIGKYMKLSPNRIVYIKTGEWVSKFRAQERERYKHPTKPWIYILENGAKTIVAPVAKKASSSLSAKAREHPLLKKVVEWETVGVAKGSIFNISNGQNGAFIFSSLYTDSILELALWLILELKLTKYPASNFSVLF